MHRLDRSRRRAALGSILLLTAATVHAQELTWGVDGAGGSGTWNATATNWWNGASNQAWSAGATARFAGAPGAVAVDGQQTVGGIIVAGSPVTLAPGAGFARIRPSQSVFNIDVQSGETTVDIEVSGIYLGNDSLRKIGPGKVTLTQDADFFDEIQVAEGEFAVRDAFDAFAADRLYLANDPSVVVTVGPFDSSAGGNLPSLDGGGPLGGVIRPAAGEGTVSLTVEGNDTEFAGRLEDNAETMLEVEFFSFFGAQILTAENPYTGATQISQSKGLILRGQGALPHSPLAVLHGSRLALDNAGSARHDRVSNTLPMTLATGTLHLIGNPLAPVSETIGPLHIGGACRIQVDQTGAAYATVSLGGLLRTASDTLDVSGSGSVTVAGLTNSPTGIVGPWLTVESTCWATVNAQQKLVPYAGYQTLLAGASPASHVYLVAPASPLPSTTMATLTVANPEQAEAGYVLDAASTLTLLQGGLLAHGAGPLRIDGGTIAAPAEPLFLSAQQDLAIDSVIAGAGLIKAGPGALALTGMNTYTGDTQVADGSLHLGADSQLGAGERVILCGGELVIEQDFTSGKILAARPTTTVGPLYLNDHTIDVGMHDAVFAAAEGPLYKIGPGRLTIATGAFDTFYLGEGMLALPGADGGHVIRNGGDLRATGRVDSLQSLNLDRSSTTPWHLFLGEDIAGLSIGSLSLTGRVQVHLDLGPAAADHLHVERGNHLWPPGDAMVLTFHNAGGLTLEQPYPIVSSSLAWPLDPAAFLVDPNQRFAGWDISLTVVPGPSSHQLLATVHAVGAEVAGEQAPDQLRVIAADPFRLTLAWNDNTELETAYEVERADSPIGAFHRIAILPPDVTLFQDTGLASYVTYRYRVRATSDSGATSYSNELEVDPPSDPYTWRKLLFSQTDPYTGPGANANDLDGDFLPNLLEFALGTSPFFAEHALAPKARLVEGAGGLRYFGLEFARPRDLWGVSFILEAATAPDEPWTVIPAPQLTITDQGDGTERVLLSNPAPLSADSPAFGLLRLRVQ